MVGIAAGRVCYCMYWLGLLLVLPEGCTNGKIAVGSTEECCAWLIREDGIQLPYGEGRGPSDLLSVPAEEVAKGRTSFALVGTASLRMHENRLYFLGLELRTSECLTPDQLWAGWVMEVGPAGMEGCGFGGCEEGVLRVLGSRETGSAVEAPAQVRLEFRARRSRQPLVEF